MEEEDRRIGALQRDRAAQSGTSKTRRCLLLLSSHLPSFLLVMSSHPTNVLFDWTLSRTPDSPQKATNGRGTTWFVLC